MKVLLQRDGAKVLQPSLSPFLPRTNNSVLPQRAGSTSVPSACTVLPPARTMPAASRATTTASQAPRDLRAAAASKACPRSRHLSSRACHQCQRCTLRRPVKSPRRGRCGRYIHQYSPRHPAAILPPTTSRAATAAAAITGRQRTRPGGGSDRWTTRLAPFFSSAVLDRWCPTTVPSVGLLSPDVLLMVVLKSKYLMGGEALKSIVKVGVASTHNLCGQLAE